MKPILFSAIFLFTQIGICFEKSEMINAKGYHLENEKLSSLILSKDEFLHLSDKDKTVYMFSMIALAQIVETSQQNLIGYENFKTDTIKTKTSFNRMNWFFALQNKAEAFWLQAGIFVAEMVAAELMIAGVKKLVTRSTTKALSKLPAIQPMSMEQARIAFKQSHPQINIGSAESLAIAKEDVKKAYSRMQLTEKLLKRNKDPKQAKKLAEDLEKANTEITHSIAKYQIIHGGNPKDLDKILNSGKGLKKYLTGENLGRVGITAAAVYGGETLFKEATATNLYQMTAESVQNLFGISEDKLQAFKSGDSSKSEGKDCLYGGHPSVWKTFDDEVLCTQPESSKSQSCQGEESFQCQTYGITLADGAIDSQMCIKVEAKDDLTFRCSQKLLNLLNEKKLKAKVSEEKFLEFTNHLQEVLKKIEDKPAMKDTEGKTKSIAAYCFADNVAQTNECAAVKHVMAYLKNTDYPTLLATRPKDAAKPAGPASAPLPAAEAAGSAEK